MNAKPKKEFVEGLRSLKLLIPFFKMIWRTSPGLTFTNIMLRLFKSAIPLGQLYVGKLIIDEVIRLINAPEKDFEQLWWWVGIELALAVFSEIFNRVITLTDALLGDLYANHSSTELMQKAASLDLGMFEDSVFYDKLERARKQTTGRVVLMSMVLSQLQDMITIFFLGAGLVVFEPWLILILFVAVLPSFVSEAHFSRSSYSLVRSWTRAAAGMSRIFARRM